MNKLILTGGLVFGLAVAAQATLYSFDFSSVNAVIPDGNVVGITESTTVSGIPYVDANNNYNIMNVDVRLNISGGYNGDLYGYLVLQSADGSTATAILLNRVGRNDASGFGSADAGFNVTLSGDATQGYANIHDVTPVNGGTYLADGRTVNPNGDFSSATAMAGLGVLNGHNANGTWTLFLADVAMGDQGTLVSWGLDITVVPEPINWALGVFAGMACWMAWRARRIAV